MTRPRRKRVSDDVLTRIAEAIQDIGADPTAPRTKREIERRTGLSHDAVARAFRQENEEDSRFKIPAAFRELVGESGRLSPARKEQLDDSQKAADLRQRLTESQTLLDRYAMALYAFHLISQQDQRTGSDEVNDAVPIGRNKRRSARD
jgi:hypothetical protein